MNEWMAECLLLEAELFARDSCILQVPLVITDNPPLAPAVHLHQSRVHVRRVATQSEINQILFLNTQRYNSQNDTSQVYKQPTVSLTGS